LAASQPAANLPLPRSPPPLGKAPGNDLAGCLEGCCRPGAGAHLGRWRRHRARRLHGQPGLTVLLALHPGPSNCSFPSMAFKQLLC